MKKYKSLALLLATVVILSSACKKKDSQTAAPSNGEYKMQFSSNVSSKPFHFDSTYHAANGKIQLTNFSFFVGQPRLVRTDGTEVSLSNELLVAFTTNIISDANRDKTSIDTSFSFTVPAGSYKAIRFGLGVPPQYNAGSNFNPFKWPQYAALGAGYGLFWDMGGPEYGYHFIYLRGRADTSSDPARRFRFSSNIEYHILGVDSSDYRNIEIPENFAIVPGSTEIKVFPIDIARVFNAKAAIDLKIQNQTDNSTPQQKPLANMILDNMQNILEEK